MIKKFVKNITSFLLKTDFVFLHKIALKLLKAIPLTYSDIFEK